MMIHRLVFEGNINIQRRAYIWNAISSIVFSVQSALFLLIATRISGETAAGGFIILFTVAQTLNSIGNYNLRDFQASDLHEDYSFHTYYTTRWLTCILMVLVAAGYGLYAHLDKNGWMVLLCLVGYRLIECIEDVYHGMIQRMGRFDVTSIFMAIRISIASIVFCLAYVVTGHQAMASILLFVSSAVFLLFELFFLKKEYPFLRAGIEIKSIRRLLLAGFPVFFGAFAYSYLINAPKYSIDALLSKDMQTLYSIMFMPVFVINMLSFFIYKPAIVRMSRLWDECNISRFRKLMLRQLAVILGITLTVAAGGYLIGLRLLEIIYAVSLSEYRMLFVLLLLFGGGAALAFYLAALITIIRRQIWIAVGYGAAFLVHLGITNRLVSEHGIAGAGYAYGAITLTACVVFIVAILKEMKTKESFH